jgi:hypothetical protein
LGLEAVTSYVTSEHRDYLPYDFDPPNWRTFISDSYQEPARFWGLLSARYVVSSSPRADPGFHLATRVSACPLSVCQPGKSAGTYIYENEHWMPRAWRVPRAVALVGEGRATFETALDLMHLPSFDPWKVVVVQVQSAAQAPDADLTFAVGQDIVGLKRWGTAEARVAFDSLLNFSAEPPVAVEFRRNHSNRFEVRAPGNGWLVVSEKVALFEGWSSLVNGAPGKIFRGDGVLGALRAPPGALVQFTYRPPGLLGGLAVFFLFACALLGVLCWRWVRHRRAALPASGK